MQNGRGVKNGFLRISLYTLRAVGGGPFVDQQQDREVRWY